ncbi:MAG: ATP-binding protein [Wenzhouxiangella sp.]|jgi:signal transduction histidine kinase|nr:ATP-binding protein [Wenzhouxiangella sp.]
MIYVAVAIAWITLSDLTVEFMFSDPDDQITASMVKGWVFVLVTGLLLYGLITRLVFQINQLAESEQALKDRQQAELESEVARRTAELRAANQELDSFAYAVSHDLRAPLRAMNGFSEALIEDHADELSDAARGHLDQIQIASARMNDLIDGLLVLSRVTRGDLDRSLVDVSAIVLAQIEQLQAREPERNVVSSIQPALVARGDRRMLEAALGNLVDNAWKYTAGACSARIEFGQTMLDGEPAFFVRDNGAGFDARHADKLFQPFQRLHRQDEFPGIGIGLATVQRVIHRHGGQISARGQIGAGAEFVFTLGVGDTGNVAG